MRDETMSERRRPTARAGSHRLQAQPLRVPRPRKAAFSKRTVAYESVRDTTRPIQCRPEKESFNINSGKTSHLNSQENRKHSLSCTYQHSRVNVDFHVVGVIESIVAEIHEVVKEENDAKEGHKLGQSFRFPVQRSSLEGQWLVLGD